MRISDWSSDVCASDLRNPKTGITRDGRWLVGMGVAAAFRNNINEKSAARVRLDRNGNVTVETDMTDIGNGSYTTIAQTAAELLGEIGRAAGGERVGQYVWISGLGQ